MRDCPILNPENNIGAVDFKMRDCPFETYFLLCDGNQQIL